MEELHKEEGRNQRSTYRLWLNKLGFNTTAFCYLEVNKRAPISAKPGSPRRLTDMSLTISDCSRQISLDFDADADGNEITNSLAKANRLKSMLKVIIFNLEEEQRLLQAEATHA